MLNQSPSSNFLSALICSDLHSHITRYLMARSYFSEICCTALEKSYYITRHYLLLLLYGAAKTKLPQWSVQELAADWIFTIPGCRMLLSMHTFYNLKNKKPAYSWEMVILIGRRLLPKIVDLDKWRCPDPDPVVSTEETPALEANSAQSWPK